MGPLSRMWSVVDQNNHYGAHDCNGKAAVGTQNNGGSFSQDELPYCKCYKIMKN